MFLKFIHSLEANFQRANLYVIHGSDGHDEKWDGFKKVALQIGNLINSLYKLTASTWKSHP